MYQDLGVVTGGYINSGMIGFSIKTPVPDYTKLTVGNFVCQLTRFGKVTNEATINLSLTYDAPSGYLVCTAGEGGSLFSNVVTPQARIIVLR